ncbi:FAD-binding oxidoreductase [Shewanella sp. NIFS-20-20]|uniref:NAD(P)/FAD-dependent oxidoreductase n=1 Tax=Shewanella sp. NIFS-20-20 TaxID=2853806 RepID=UPI001C478B80|nr:FAD-dependent oxidoreductase [Shewanella sp. NIFS-20-20]MBV7315124.1 FAD-binding oxidoreductase [Shewanella sp. NIFS-20-20]
MLNTNDQDICVLGAGVVGLTSALYLQQAGYQVTLLDKQGVALGASFGNAGHFATEQVFPLADPKLLLTLPQMLMDPLGPLRIRPQYLHRALPWFLRFMVNMSSERRLHNKQGIKALNEQSISAIKALVTSCGCEHLLTLNGSLLVFEHTALFDIRHQWQSYVNEGIAVTLLTGQQVRELEPCLSRKITYALWFTDVGHTEDPYQLCLAIFNKFISLGGAFTQADVTKINVNNPSAPLTLTIEDTDIEINKLLLTAGAWSRPFAKQLGYKVPLETERGYHLMMPQQSNLTRPVASYERKMIITPMATGTRLAGTVEFGGLDAPMSLARADCLLPHAKALMPSVFLQASADQGQRWMGFRPSLPDSLPVISQTHHDNVFVSFGHQHLGLTWSAISAQLTGELIQGHRPTIDMGFYRIDRF